MSSSFSNSSLFRPFRDIVANIGGTIASIRSERNIPVIGVMPGYFPVEYIDAAGGYAVQFWGNSIPIVHANSHLQVFCCSVASSLLELELSGRAGLVDAYVFTSLCDTLINLREIYRRLFDKPTIELSMPITQTMAARKSYLTSSLTHIRLSIEAVTGTPITTEKLTRAATERGETRRLQRALYRFRLENPGTISNTDFYAMLKSGFFLPTDVYNPMLRELRAQLNQGVQSDRKAGVKILFSGMVFDPLSFHSLLDERGIAIVDDDLANGWRTVSKPVLGAEDLEAGLTEYLFGPAPCCCLYNPGLDRHEYLVEKYRHSKADGILLWYINFCEPDAFDRPQLVERLKAEGIPTITINVDLATTNLDNIRTRIDAFIEMLGG